MDKKFETLGADLRKEMQDQLEKGLADVQSKANEAVKEHNSEKLAEAEKSIGEISENIKNVLEANEAAEKRIDELEVSLKKAIEAGDETETKTFLGRIKDELGTDDFKDWQKNKSGQFALKAAGDMTTGNTYTNDVIEPGTVRTDVVYAPERVQRLRQIIPMVTTDRDSVRYIKESAYTDGTATRAEGASIAQSDFDLTETKVDIENISAFTRVTRDMLDDTAFLAGYINTRMRDKLLNVEDTQLLTGNASTPNLNGIQTQATAYAEQTTIADSGAQEYDVLLNAVTQVNSSNHNANWIVLNPADRLALMLVKDSNKQYIYPNDVRAGGRITVDGVPIFVTGAQTSGTFLVGDFNEAQMVMREDGLIEVWLQDGSNATKRQATITINERLAVIVYNTTAFVTTTFANAIALGTA